MPIDITKLSQRASAFPAQDGVRDLAALAGLDAAEHIRKMLSPTLAAQSLIETMAEEEARRRQSIADALGASSSLDRFMEQHQQLTAAGLASHYAESPADDEMRSRKRYLDLLSAPAELAMNSLLQRTRDLERAMGFYGPASSAFDAAETVGRRIDDVYRAIDPLRSFLDQIRVDQTTAAAWVHQLQPAAEIANRFSAWPIVDELHDDVDWHALEESLAGVDAVMQKLPLQNAKSRDLKALGLTRYQWITLVLTIFTALVALLDYLETREQNRFERQQAAEEQVEERIYRQRAISALEKLAEHTPSDGPDHFYVVGTRPTRVKSAISGGLYLGTAYPGQVIVATDHRGRWLKIKYRDNLDERDVEGWVPKHYLILRPEHHPDLP